MIYPLVYDHLRNEAHYQLRRERVGHTLETTALVHEAYLKIVDQEKANFNNRTHFLAVAALAMRQNSGSTAEIWLQIFLNVYNTY